MKNKLVELEINFKSLKTKLDGKKLQYALKRV